MNKISSLSVAISFATLSIVVPIVAHATTYYVDSINGNDSNNGQSTAGAFRSFVPINSMSFAPGDTILLNVNSTWQGLLLPCTLTKCSGTAAAPIKIDKFGTPTNPTTHPLPVLNGAGAGRATVSLLNQSYWEIRNLEVTNTGPSGFNYAGIEVLCDSANPTMRECHHIYIGHNHIHDVNGVAAAYSNAGIVVAENIQNAYWGAVGGGQFGWISNSNYWDDVVIEWNTIERIDRVGILASDYPAAQSPICAPAPSAGCTNAISIKSTNIAIRNNSLFNIQGDGILVGVSNGAIIEYNVVGNWGLGGGKYAGIWSDDTIGTVIQHNEVYGSLQGDDRTAFDIDWGNISTYIQYNYSHHNYGGMMLLEETFDGVHEGLRDVYIDDPIVRFNISIDDGVPGAGVVIVCFNRWSHGANPLDFANNTIYQSATNFYFGSRNTTPIFSVCGQTTPPNCSGSAITGTGYITGAAYIYNNIFYTEGAAVWPTFDAAGFGDNIFYQPGGNQTCQPGDGGALNQNPLFWSFPSTPGSPNDVRLKAGSPALSTGYYTAFLGPSDYFGNAVPVNGTPNRGAYDGPGL
jgi:hypothetical protein